MNSAMIKWRTDSSDILYDTYNMIYVCTWRLPVHQQIKVLVELQHYEFPSELNHGSSGSSLEGVRISQ